MTSLEIYNKLKPFLATTKNFGGEARRANIKSPRHIEFAPEERRPVKCWLPVRWVPPYKKLWKDWVRLTYAQFCDAYGLEMELL